MSDEDSEKNNSRHIPTLLYFMKVYEDFNFSDSKNEFFFLTVREFLHSSIKNRLQGKVLESFRKNAKLDVREKVFGGVILLYLSLHVPPI